MLIKNDPACLEPIVSTIGLAVTTLAELGNRSTDKLCWLACAVFAVPIASVKIVCSVMPSLWFNRQLIPIMSFCAVI